MIVEPLSIMSLTDIQIHLPYVDNIYIHRLSAVTALTERLASVPQPQQQQQQQPPVSPMTALTAKALK
jgi:hypothetical protein